LRPLSFASITSCGIHGLPPQVERDAVGLSIACWWRAISPQARAASGSVPETGSQPSVNERVALLELAVWLVTAMWTSIAEWLPPPQPLAATTSRPNATSGSREVVITA
jgi:hypothetical protein